MKLVEGFLWSPLNYLYRYLQVASSSRAPCILSGWGQQPGVTLQPCWVSRGHGDSAQPWLRVLTSMQGKALLCRHGEGEPTVGHGLLPSPCCALWHCSHHPLSPTEPKLMAKIKEDKKVAGTFIILGVERDVYSFLSEVVPLW